MTPPLDRYAVLVHTLGSTLETVLRMTEPHEGEFEQLLDAADEAAGADGIDEDDEARIANETGWVRFAAAVRALADLCTEVEARHHVAAARRAEEWVTRHG